MRLRQPLIAIGVSVGALLLPACQAIRSQCSCLWPDEAPGEVSDAQGAPVARVPQVIQVAEVAKPVDRSIGDGEARVAAETQTQGVLTAPPKPDEPVPPGTIVIQQKPPSDPTAPVILGSPATLPDVPARAEVKPVERPAGAIKPATAGASTAPYALVRALYEFLEDRPESAIQTLSGFDPHDQNLLLRLIPVIAQIEKARALAPRISADDRLALVQVVRNWLAEAQDSAPLVVDKLVFCKEVLAFGKYQPVHSHRFRPGDRVMVYAELQNLCDRKANGEDVYITRLAATLAIRDASFQVLGKPILFRAESKSRSFRTDHFARMIFPIPGDLPPGYYTLRVEITDLNSQRQAEKVLDFHITTLTAAAGK